MKEFLEFTLLVALILSINMFAYMKPDVAIRFRKGRSMFSEKSKYNVFSKGDSEEFRNDVLRYKEQSKVKIVVILIVYVLILFAGLIGSLA